jgi:hypothetical protein
MKKALVFLILLAVSNAAQASDFNEACYLARYPDVLVNWVYRGSPALQHWLQFGAKEHRIPDCSGDPSPIASPAMSIVTPPYPNQMTIKSKPVDGSNIELTSFPVEFGGAFASLKWNGVEFINHHDRGRELQSASHFDEHGECYNPTEAGTYSDRLTSSSQVLEAIASYSSLSLKTHPAFWLYGKRVGGGCKFGAQVSAPQQSNHVFNKIVQMNYDGDPQVIDYRVQYQNLAGFPKKLGVYEALTGYLTTDFQRVMSVQMSTGVLIEENGFQPISGAGVGNGATFLRRDNKFDPIIVSNAAGTHAMGILFPTQELHGAFDGYQVWKFPGASGAGGDGTVKWNAAIFENSSNQPQRSFRILLVIGTVANVHEKLKSLALKHGFQSQ